MALGMGFSVIALMAAILVFIGIVIIFAVVIIKLIGNSRNNNRSPILSVQAHVVGKRANMHDGHTWYYITYQVESGDRMEFVVIKTEFAMLAEGDAGRLTFQGDRYLGFERDVAGQNRQQ